MWIPGKETKPYQDRGQLLDKRHYVVNLGELISELGGSVSKNKTKRKPSLGKGGGVGGVAWRRANNEGCARKQDGGEGVRKTNIKEVS